MCVYPQHCTYVLKIALSPFFSIADKLLHYLPLRKKYLLCSQSAYFSLSYFPSMLRAEESQLTLQSGHARNHLFSKAGYKGGNNRMFYSCFLLGQCSHNYYTLLFPIQVIIYSYCLGGKFWIENFFCTYCRYKVHNVRRKPENL